MVAMATVALGGVAAAHVSDPTIVTVVDGFSPELPGVGVEVAESVTPELVVTNPNPTELTVFGDYGEAFLRIGAQGVFANLGSPTWYLTNSPTAVASVPPTATPSAAPSWAQVSTQPTWGWFEHRMHVGTEVLSQRVPSRPTVIKRWTVPLRYGAQDATVHGRVLRRPLTGGYSAGVRRVTPSVAGLAVQVAPGAVPAVFVDYRGSAPIVVLGPEREPFLRVGPDGVEANLHSPLWIDNLRTRDQEVGGLLADPTAPPSWSRVSAEPTIAWLDPRGLVDRPGGTGSNQARRWSVPVLAGRGRSSVDLTSGLVTGS